MPGLTTAFLPRIDATKEAADNEVAGAAGRAVAPPGPDEKADPARPRAINVHTESAEAGNPPPRVQEEKLQLVRGATVTNTASALKQISKTCLPRGGTCVSTVVGPIQVGVPPETIKDSMAKGLPVPQYFLLPPESLCRTLGNSLGVNVAEFEFPAYYNFFLKNQPIKLIVGSADCERRIRAIMQETLLGPAVIDTDVDFAPSVKPEDRPNLVKELAYFRIYNGKELSIDSLISFVHLDRRGVVTIEGKKDTPGAGFLLRIAVSVSNGGEFVITEFERTNTSADESTGEHEECRNRREASTTTDRYEVGDGDSKIPGTNWNDPELVVRTDNVATTKSNSREGRARLEILEQIPDEDNVGKGGGVEESGEGSGVNGEEAARAELVRQDATRACGWNGPSNPHEDLMEAGALSSGDGDGGNTSSNARFAPVPPKNKLTPPVSQRLGQGVSAVKRFARSVVRSATDGSSRNKVGDVKSRRGGAVEANADGAEIQAEGDDIRKPALAGGDSGGVATSVTVDTRDLDPPAVASKGASAGAYVKGFRPVREVAISMTCPLPSLLPFHPKQTEEEFAAPNFGVTVLGNSHGFDPKGSTSGYVLWISGRGYMIDPPPYASMILQSFNIRPSLIAGVIVTHCHADHDAGTFQRILLDGKVSIVSTTTIYESFIRKYSALSAMNPGLIRQSHSFVPVKIGESLRLHGASFDFFYTLHSIPCIGFEVAFGGKSMVFSADHMNDPERVRAMYDEGFLTIGRRDALLDFPWHHDVIFHEAGIPPIHTPMRTLEELPEDVKSRLYVVHVSKSSIPKGSGLRVPPTGVENTIRLETPENYYGEAMEVLDLICSVGMLRNISASQARSLLEVGRRTKCSSGTILQRRCVDIAHFAIICRGKAVATVMKPAGARRSYVIKENALRRGDSYGEEPAPVSPPPTQFHEELLLAGSARRKGYVSVKAETDMEVLLFDGRDVGQIFDLKLKTLDEKYRLDRLLVDNSVLCALSRKQVLHLESLTQAVHLASGEVVWEAGQPVERVVVVAKGKLAFRLKGAHPLISGSDAREGKTLKPGERPRRIFCPEYFLPGALIGRAGTLLDPPSSNQYAYDLEAVIDSVVLVISRADMTVFSYSNPGVFMAIHDLQFVS